MEVLRQLLAPRLDGDPVGLLFLELFLAWTEDGCCGPVQRKKLEKALRTRPPQVTPLQQLQHQQLLAKKAAEDALAAQLAAQQLAVEQAGKQPAGSAAAQQGGKGAAGAAAAAGPVPLQVDVPGGVAPLLPATPPLLTPGANLESHPASDAASSSAAATSSSGRAASSG
jgi:hypothetical protein